MVKILYKIPSRGRHKNLWRLIDNIKANARLPRDEFSILLTLDNNDVALNNAFNRSAFEKDELITVDWGHSNSKIHAFNRGVPADGWQLLVCPSDDIQFTPGFDEVLWNYYQQTGPDTAHHYPDGAEHGLIWTVPVLDKAYYERFGYVYYPNYFSLYCDEEAIAVGKANGRMWFWPDEIMEHLHPNWNKAPTDMHYKRANAFGQLDKKMFEKRKLLGFPNTKVR